jgi:hypothetical protein
VATSEDRRALPSVEETRRVIADIIIEMIIGGSSNKEIIAQVKAQTEQTLTVAQVNKLRQSPLVQYHLANTASEAVQRGLASRAKRIDVLTSIIDSAVNTCITIVGDKTYLTPGIASADKHLANAVNAAKVIGEMVDSKKPDLEINVQTGDGNSAFANRFGLKPLTEQQIADLLEQRRQLSAKDDSIDVTLIEVNDGE